MKKNLLKPLTCQTALIAIALFIAPAALAFQPFMTPVSTPYHWNTTANPTINWQVGAGAPAIVHDAMGSVFQAWSDATGGAFKFAEGPGGVLVDWDATGAQIPDPLYLAYTTFGSNNTGIIQNAHIIVNAANYTWHRGGFGGVGMAGADGKRDSNLDSVLLHELGHALGLDHSDKNASAIVGTVVPGDPPTMNSVIYPNAGTLHTDDIAGIRSLYQANAATQTAPSSITLTASVSSGKAPLQTEFSQIGGDASTTWNFGDGSTANGVGAKHTFSANGAYTVTVECQGVQTTATILVGTKAINAAKAALKASQKAAQKSAAKDQKRAKTLS